VLLVVFEGIGALFVARLAFALDLVELLVVLAIILGLLADAFAFPIVFV
jgi:hypothetical protein